MISYEIKYRIKERLEKLLRPLYLERAWAKMGVKNETVRLRTTSDD